MCTSFVSTLQISLNYSKYLFVATFIQHGLGQGLPSLLHLEYFDLAHQFNRVVYFHASESASEQLRKHVCTRKRTSAVRSMEKKPLICSFGHLCGNASESWYAGWDTSLPTTPWYSHTSKYQHIPSKPTLLVGTFKITDEPAHKLFFRITSKVVSVFVFGSKLLCNVPCMKNREVKIHFIGKI